MITEPLDTALLLEEDGHLSEVGAATLADGQDELVPQEILRHVEGCPVCMERLGEQAVQTELAQRVIGSIGSPEEAGQSAEIPWWALAAAATLALLGALPTLLATETWRSATTLLRVVPATALTIQRTMQEPEAAAALERARWWGSVVLVVAGVALVAATRNKEQGEGR